MSSQMAMPDVREAIRNKLREPTYANIQTTPEELSNYAILNIERNCDLDRMTSNLRLFMGDCASSFAYWLLSLTRPDLLERPPDCGADISLSASKDEDIETYDGSPDRFTGRRRWARDVDHERYVSESEDSDDDCAANVRRIPSVITATRTYESRKRVDIPYSRGATHIFLRAVGEANLSTTNRSRSNNYQRNERPQQRNLLPVASNDLRHRINAARLARAGKSVKDCCAYQGDPVGAENFERISLRQRRFSQRTTSVSDSESRKRPANDVNEPDVQIPTKIPRKKRVRCKFWPKCARGETCEYVHPSEDCKLFPNCKFGSTCLYIHPLCPQDGFCPKPDCPYSHNKHFKTVLNLPNNPFKLNRLKPEVCPLDANCRQAGCTKAHPNRTKFTCKNAFKWIKAPAEKNDEPDTTKA